VSALHSSVFARLASGAFYETIVLLTFYEIITLKRKIRERWNDGRMEYWNNGEP